MLNGISLSFLHKFPVLTNFHLIITSSLIFIPHLNLSVHHVAFLTFAPSAISRHQPLSSCRVLLQRHAHSVQLNKVICSPLLANSYRKPCINSQNGSSSVELCLANLCLTYGFADYDCAFRVIQSCIIIIMGKLRKGRSNLHKDGAVANEKTKMYS